MLNNALKKLCKDINMSEAQMQKEWNAALDIADAKVGRDSKTRFAFATKVLKNRLKLVAHSAAMFEAFCASNPEWFEEYSYNQQKEYIESHPSTEFKISKKKPHKSGRTDIKTPEQKRRERLYNKSGKETTLQTKKGTGSNLTVVEKHSPESDERSEKDDRLDRLSDHAAEEAGGKIHNLPATQTEFSERTTKNMVNVGHRALAEDLDTISERALSHADSEDEVESFKKLTDADEKLTPEDAEKSPEFKKAKNLAGKVGKGLLLSVAAIALFTPLAPFGVLIGAEYLKHQLGFKDNMFDELRSNSDEFLDRIAGHRKESNTEVDSEKGKKKKKQDAEAAKRLADMTKQATGQEKEINPAPSSTNKKKKEKKVLDADFSESAFYAFAGDNHDLVKEMAKNMYDTICTVDVAKLHKALTIISDEKNGGK